MIVYMMTASAGAGFLNPRLASKAFSVNVCSMAFQREESDHVDGLYGSWQLRLRRSDSP
jgi:hypothetical protein